MSIDKGRCELCGGELEFRQQGSVQGYFCKECDWSVVTTATPRMLTDKTLYKVLVTNGDHHDKRQIIAVAKVAGVNFLTARKLLQQKEVVVLSGEAVKVFKVVKILSSAGLVCNTIPSFPY